MPNQGWGQALISSTADGSALASSTTATSLLPGAAKFQLPANFLTVGSALRVTAFGRVSNIVTTPGTLTLDVRFGGVVVFNGAAMPLNTTAKTNVSWWLQAILTCRTIGTATTATMFGGGRWVSESANSAVAGTAGTVMMPASAPAAGTGFDSTATQVVDLFGTWSISNAGNSIQVHEYLLESLN